MTEQKRQTAVEHLNGLKASDLTPWQQGAVWASNIGAKARAEYLEGLASEKGFQPEEAAA